MNNRAFLIGIPVAALLMVAVSFGLRSFTLTGQLPPPGGSSSAGFQASASSGDAIIICTPVCGDGLVTMWEECDDSNTTDGDGCSHLCMSEGGSSSSGSSTSSGSSSSGSSTSGSSQSSTSSASSAASSYTSNQCVQCLAQCRQGSSSSAGGQAAAPSNTLLAQTTGGDTCTPIGNGESVKFSTPLRAGADTDYMLDPVWFSGTNTLYISGNGSVVEYREDGYDAQRNRIKGFVIFDAAAGTTTRVPLPDDLLQVALHGGHPQVLGSPLTKDGTKFVLILRAASGNTTVINYRIYDRATATWGSDLSSLPSGMDLQTALQTGGTQSRSVWFGQMDAYSPTKLALWINNIIVRPYVQYYKSYVVSADGSAIAYAVYGIDHPGGPPGYKVFTERILDCPKSSSSVGSSAGVQGSASSGSSVQSGASSASSGASSAQGTSSSAGSSQTSSDSSCAICFQQCLGSSSAASSTSSGSSQSSASSGSSDSSGSSTSSGSSQSSTSSGSSQSSIYPFHAECQGGGCVIVAGAGDPLCRDNADCVLTHAECRTKRCVQIPGPGSPQCGVDLECDTVHTECSSVRCAVVQGYGTDQCGVDLQCNPEGYCGDGIVTPGEACDDGNIDDADSCSNRCLRNPTEPCTNGADCVSGLCVGNQCVPCSSDLQCAGGRICLEEACVRCGDGVVSPPEACDDGNLVNTDSCSNRCQKTVGQQCVEDAQCASGFCINGFCRACTTDQQCGTGRMCVSGACVLASSCTLDSQCGPGRICLFGKCSQCGDGIVTPPEACDDANRTDGDVCSNRCQKGVGQSCSSLIECTTELCLNGACSRCISNAQCAPGRNCINGVCAAMRGSPGSPLAASTVELPFTASGTYGGTNAGGMQGSLLNGTQPHAPVGKTGPAALAAMAAGAAAGVSWMRRKKREG